MVMLINAISKALRHILAPPFCVRCKKWLSDPIIFCNNCVSLIRPVTSVQLKITSTVTISVFALSSYQDPLKALILAKIQSQKLASQQLGNLLWEMPSVKLLEFDYVIPIPLHWTRYAYRGFNQAEVIASVIAQKSNKPLAMLLKRNRRTLFQSQLSLEERLQNVNNVFDLKNQISQNDYRDKHLLLIDDLMTSGATLKIAAKKLLALKPKSISAAVICRVT